MEVKLNQSEVIMNLRPADAKLLEDVLHRYHEVDTLMKGVIADDDDHHYMAESLHNMLNAFNMRQPVDRA